MKYLVIICLILNTSILWGQNWCSYDPHIERTSFNHGHKTHVDRFTHSNKPQTVEKAHMHIESSVTCRNEYLRIMESYDEPGITNNIYSNHRIRYSFIQGVDFNASFNDVIIYTGNEVTEYGGPSPYTRISVGGKYLIYDSRQKIALNGQVFFPKKDFGLTISPEFRVLYSIEVSRGVTGVINLGGIMIDTENKFLIYSLELDWHITKRTILISEIYRNGSHLTAVSNTNYFLLFGIGNYLKENTFWYLTYENDFYKTQYLSKGRLDIGLAFVVGKHR